MYISFVAFWNEYDMISLVYLVETYLDISNTFYLKYFGYIRVLTQLKNSVFSARLMIENVYLRIRHNNFSILFL